MSRTIWKSFEVGGDPDTERWLADNLRHELVELQAYDWDVVSVDRNVISHAWSINQHKYVETVQYIIIAKAEEEEDIGDVSEE